MEFRNHTEHGNAFDIQTLNSLSIVPNDKLSEQMPMRQQIPQINKNNPQRIVNRRMTTQGLQANERANEKTITHNRTSYRISGTIVAPQSKLCMQRSLSQISVMPETRCKRYLGNKIYLPTFVIIVKDVTRKHRHCCYQRRLCNQRWMRESRYLP